MSEDLSIIVCSCKQYSCLWNELLLNFSLHLNNLTKHIYFTSSDSRAKEDRIQLNYSTYFLSKEDDNLDWSSRLLKTIHNIKTDYFVLMIEDYFLKQDIDKALFNQVFNEFKSNKKMGYIKLSEHRSYLNNAKQYTVNKYIFEKKSATFRLSAQASLWKKEYALKVIRKGESAWLFEANCSYRSRFYKAQPFSLNIQKFEIMDYFEGKLIHQGVFNQEIVEYIERNDGIIINQKIDLESAQLATKNSFFKKIYRRLYLPFSVLFKIKYRN